MLSVESGHPLRQDWPFEGQVKHRICRAGIPTPSNWPSICREVCEHSSRKPDVWLQLEHVFGYNGPKNIQPNTFYIQDPATGNTEVLYYTSAVGIIYEPGAWPLAADAARR